MRTCPILPKKKISSCLIGAKYIDEINFTIMLGREAADIRKVIDILYDNYYNKPKAKKNKR